MQKKDKCLRERFEISERKRAFACHSLRSGQGGINAAILVAIIAGLIILYIIFLPTSERQNIIGNEKTKATGAEEPNVLLKVNPGTLTLSQRLENEKGIPNANIT